MATDEKIRLVFIDQPFKGADRTLLFYKPRKWPTIPPSVFRPLQSTLAKLAQQNIAEVALHEEPYIQVIGTVELYARCLVAGASEAVAKGVSRRGPGDRASFDWAGTPDHWSLFVGLLAAFVSSSGGHQYLRSGPSEDALIMVSSGEYFDADFESLA
jgi:hypothetical protein